MFVWKKVFKKARRRKSKESIDRKKSAKNNLEFPYSIFVAKKGIRKLGIQIKTSTVGK